MKWKFCPFTTLMSLSFWVKGVLCGQYPRRGLKMFCFLLLIHLKYFYYIIFQSYIFYLFLFELLAFSEYLKDPDSLPLTIYCMCVFICRYPSLYPVIPPPQERAAHLNGCRMNNKECDSDCILWSKLKSQDDGKSWVIAGFYHLTANCSYW